MESTTVHDCEAALSILAELLYKGCLWTEIKDWWVGEDAAACPAEHRELIAELDDAGIGVERAYRLVAVLSLYRARLLSGAQEETARVRLYHETRRLENETAERISLRWQRLLLFAMLIAVAAAVGIFA